MLLAGLGAPHAGAACAAGLPAGLTAAGLTDGLGTAGAVAAAGDGGAAAGDGGEVVGLAGACVGPEVVTGAQAATTKTANTAICRARTRRSLRVVLAVSPP